MSLGSRWDEMETERGERYLRQKINFTMHRLRPRKNGGSLNFTNAQKHIDRINTNLTYLDEYLRMRAHMYMYFSETRPFQRLAHGNSEMQLHYLFSRGCETTINRYLP